MQLMPLGCSHEVVVLQQGVVRYYRRRDLFCSTSKGNEYDEVDDVCLSGNISGTIETYFGHGVKRVMK